LADAHERLDAALAHPLVDDTDVVVVLGDLAHFGDRTSVRRTVDAVAYRERPAVLLSGNHDVLTPGVRLEDEVVDRGAALVVSPLACETEAPAVKAFAAAGAGLAVHEVTAESDRRLRPFDVTGRRLAGADPVGALDVFLTHFPLLSFEDRCRDARLLYSGHLEMLAPPPVVLPAAGRPALVLSGHLHLRGVTTAASVLQIAFAALVEAPYEVAVVEIDVAARSIAYQCASVIEPDAERLPVLDPSSGRWTFDPESGRWTTSS
jgi:predicted MPP superfamily phosphohydrolase